MDPLTHALSGALLGRATARRDAPPRSVPRRIAAGFFACASPDLDFVYSFFGPAEYVLNHRGITHSLLLLPLWAIPVAWVLAIILREPRGWKALYGISALGIGAHIAGDLITTYGTMILAPFSDWRASLGTTFIIDLWLSGIIVAGLAFSLALYKTRLPAIIAFVVLAGYIGFQALQRSHAVDFATEYALKSGLAGARIAVHPRPPTPYNWTLFVSDGETHRFAHVNLVRQEEKRYQPGDGFIAKLDAPYLPLERAIWVKRSRYGETQQELNKEAWNSPPLAFLRWFAEEPAYDGGSGDCAWFVDLRFDTPGRDYVPFRFGACREGNTWRGYERGVAGERIPLR